ncbi:unnamed protein product [Merluccius merluccius]
MGRAEEVEEWEENQARKTQRRLTEEEEEEEAAEAKGDAPEKSTKRKKKKRRSSEGAGDGKSSKKVRPPGKEATSASSNGVSVKEEPEDQELTQKTGVKRKRSKEEASSSSSTSKKNRSKKGEQGEERSTGAPKDKKLKSGKDKVKEEEEEEGGQPKKTKKTKEQIEEARRMKIKMKEEEEQKRWRWWEEEKYEDGVKWKFLEHKGPFFPPEYESLPDNVRFYYNGKVVKLSLAAEEVALFFAQMLDHEYTTKDVFRENFFKDWRKEMNNEERLLIQDLNKCDFGELHAMHKAKVETRKTMSKEEKLVLKVANQKIVEDYGFCLLDHHRERIGNFKIEPPGLFRGRGEHPKQGMLKKRIQPEDVIINCSKESSIPAPPAGHRWKEVRHDNAVTWLASWTENIQGSIKYIMLNANSKLKGEKDWEKYEVARKLKVCVEGIRRQYTQDFKSKQMGTRQRAVALYFIDKLALRAGNEKEEGETADTVGCCSLRVEHISVHDKLDGSEFVVEFDFLGKDSIRYYNKVPVEKRVFKNLILFMENKDPGDELFDRLNVSIIQILCFTNPRGNSSSQSLCSR